MVIRMRNGNKSSLAPMRECCFWLLLLEVSATVKGSKALDTINGCNGLGTENRGSDDEEGVVWYCRMGVVTRRVRSGR
jgi:hypothetical protein